MGVAGQASQWEVVGVVSLLPRAPFAPTPLLPLLPILLLLPASAPGGSHMSPLASLPLPHLAQPIPPSCPFLPALTLSCCRSSEVTFLTRFCPRRDLAGARILHLVPVLTDGSNIACFDCLAQLIFGGMG